MNVTALFELLLTTGELKVACADEKEFRSLRTQLYRKQANIVNKFGKLYTIKSEWADGVARFAYVQSRQHKQYEVIE